MHPTEQDFENIRPILPIKTYLQQASIASVVLALISDNGAFTDQSDTDTL